MTCKELLRLLNDYVDGDLEPGFCAEFEKHFAECAPCRVVVDTLRKTITIYKGQELYELPAPFRERLNRALQARWKELYAPREGEPPLRSSE
ncbi:MAG: anti-sigma factor family protein [Planctomycetota bacterium]